MPSSRRLGRSVLAILAAIVLGIVLSLGTDELMRAAGLLAPLGERASDGSLLIATLYRTVYGIAGAALTARLAPHTPMRHALILGGLGTAVALLGAIATWNAGPQFGPHWYAVALVILALPQSWLGARLAMRAA